MRTNYRKRIFPVLICILICCGSPVFSQHVVNYRTIFGNNWEKASSFVANNENWMKLACKKQNIPYPFAVAIVFPELVRYSALRDKMEISLLKTLYINLGEEYADFSIGSFQIKPSFAETVYREVKKLNDRKIKNLFKNKGSAADLKDFRASIVSELENAKSEFNYLLAFIKICDNNYPRDWKDEYEKLKFYATAYNYGITKSAEDIEAMSEKKFFSTHLFKSETYSYSDVSVYWYTNNH